MEWQRVHLHESLAVGDPNGFYMQFSFALTLSGFVAGVDEGYGLAGQVYIDDSSPGSINPDMYWEITSDDAFTIMAYMTLKKVGQRFAYSARYNCRWWSRESCKAIVSHMIESERNPVKAVPPKRSVGTNVRALGLTTTTTSASTSLPAASLIRLSFAAGLIVMSIISS